VDKNGLNNVTCIDRAHVLGWKYLNKLEISAEKHKNTNTIFDIIKMPQQITSVTMEVTSA
jgi:hypothetical protein